MLIQLKQAEIVSAIKQYVIQQGINLAGKTVDIAFTSGRKENGLSADVTIEDQDIPGTDTGDVVEVAVKPVLTVVTGAPVLEKTDTPAPVPEPQAPVDAPAVPDVKQDDAAEAKTKPSLFG